MDEFQYWQRWGLELGDKEFANAFLALGILSATPSSKNLLRPVKVSEGRSRELEVLLSSAYIEDRLRTILTNFEARNQLISWRFPRRRQLIELGGKRIISSNFDPSNVAHAWPRAIEGYDTTPRFQVIGYPETERIKPWFRILFEAAPQKKAGFIQLTARHAHLNMKWQLRLGFLPGNAAEECVHAARFWWPAAELTKVVRIDRENANCDILLFIGDSDQLLKALLESPVPQKANLFIVRGSFEDDISVAIQRLSAIAAEGRASGFVFLNPTISNEVLGRALNRFVENLSHNQPVDLAVSEAFAGSYMTDPVLFLSGDLAKFQLDHILEGIYGRLKSLPKAARPPIQSGSFAKMGLPESGLEDGLTIAENAAEILKEHKDAVIFEHEDTGASGIAEVNEAIDLAETEADLEYGQMRFLQTQVFIKKGGKFVRESRVFLRDVPALLRVRIGPTDKEWPAIKTAFPAEKLPKGQKEWRLTIVITEPYHLTETLRQSIKLSRFGPSTVCEFRIKPRGLSPFEARITVLHRGRVLQTGLITGRVVSDESDISTGDAIALTELIAVRSNLGDLEGRRQFDLAFVLNHTTDERPRLTAIASKHAWCIDLEECRKIAIDINLALSKITRSVDEYNQDLESDANRTLLVKLANLGNALYWSIVEEQLSIAGNRPDIGECEYIQIVSTKSDAIVPFEFIYELEAPDDDAKLCPSWQDALAKGSCGGCNTEKTKYVCPLGFWGVRKVIERHDLTPELGLDGRDFYLQSEPTERRRTLSITGAAVVAASARVENSAFVPVISACTDQFGAVPLKAHNWENWAELVQQYEPHVLIALTHTDGDGIEATLEIGGNAIKSNQIKEKHVRSKGAKGYPLVALLGCDTTGTALEYGSHVRWFRRKGAAVVVGTVATVFGEHAAKMAEMFIKGLRQHDTTPQCLGEVIRSIKRRALLDGLLMALCIVAYGDADWKLN
jgi:hypothetical protein